MAMADNAGRGQADTAEGGGDRVADRMPCRVDAVRQSGRAALALRDRGAVGQREAHAGACSTAIDTDEIFDHVCFVGF
jgi:hypothetical protein